VLGRLLAAVSPMNTPHGYNWTFAYPMLLFIVVAGALYLRFRSPHKVPGHAPITANSPARASMTAAAGTTVAGTTVAGTTETGTGEAGTEEAGTAEAADVEPAGDEPAGQVGQDGPAADSTGE